MTGPIVLDVIHPDTVAYLDGRLPAEEWTTEDATATAVLRFLLVNATHLQQLIDESYWPAADAPEAARTAHRDLLGRFVQTWSTAHLLRVIREEMPGRADELAAEVWGAWEDGGEMHELLWEYKQAEGLDPDARIEASS